MGVFYPKILIILLLPLFAKGNRCGSGGDWVQYKDEKCYLLTQDFVTSGNALNLCLAADPSASLPVVKSSEEQQFIDNFLYVEHGVQSNVWLGATRVNSTQEFAWADGDDLTSYANWAPGHPSDDSTKICARIVSSAGKSKAESGQWEDVACGTLNLALCQKPTQFSHEELVQEIFKLRYNLNQAEKDHLEFKEETQAELETQKEELDDTSNKLEITTTNLGVTTSKLDETTSKLDETRVKLENTTTKLGQMEIDMGKIIPVGFLYFQVGTQPSPRDLWPGYSWTDVSSTYPGLFFRVTGGGAAAIGTIQAENAPRLGNVRHYDNVGSYPISISVPSSGWSQYVKVGSHDPVYIAHTEGLGFEMTNIGEVRPKNTAMRVWKRT